MFDMSHILDVYNDLYMYRCIYRSYVYKHIFIHIYIYINKYLYIYMYRYMYILYMYIYIYIHIFVYIYMNSLSFSGKFATFQHAHIYGILPLVCAYVHMTCTWVYHLHPLPSQVISAIRPLI
jgi:hypothetical protein